MGEALTGFVLGCVLTAPLIVGIVIQIVIDHSI